MGLDFKLLKKIGIWVSGNSNTVITSKIVLLQADAFLSFFNSVYIYYFKLIKKKLIDFFLSLFKK